MRDKCLGLVGSGACDTGRVSESIEIRWVDGIWFGELSGTNVVVIKMRVKNTTNIDKDASP